MSILQKLKTRKEFYEKCIKVRPDFDEFFIEIEKVLNSVDRAQWQVFIFDCALCGDIAATLKKYAAPIQEPKTIWGTFSEKEKLEFEEKYQPDETKRQTVVSTFASMMAEQSTRRQINGANVAAAYRKALVLGFPVSKTTVYPLLHFGTVILKEHPVFFVDYVKKVCGASDFIVESYTKDELKCVPDETRRYVKSELVPLSKIQTVTFENVAIFTVKVDWVLRESNYFAFTKEQLIERVLCMEKKRNASVSIASKWGTNDHFLLEMLTKTAIYFACKRLGIHAIYEMDTVINGGDGNED